MEKILILKSFNYNLVRKLSYCDIDNYYKEKYDPNSKFLILIRKLKIKFNLMFFGNWKKNIKKYDKVIFFDNGFNEVFSYWIKKINPKCKTILWIWNPISNRQMRFLNDKNLDEIYSYSEKDSQKYGIKYNTTFYNKELKENFVQNNEVYDIVFLGRNKNRKNIIENFKNDIKNYNLKTNFKIIEDGENEISYYEYLNWISKSKAILDIVNNIYQGPTLRTMESIFLNKKMITNNREIMNYEFYNKNNFFILGIDDINNIESFVNSSYVRNDKKILNYFEFENWLLRF